MSVTIESFGTTKKGEKASLYTLENANGMKASISDFGAVLVKLLVKDKEGRSHDVVWGYDHVEGYENNGVFLGATIGRNANRIGKARFIMGGTEYTLDVNDGNNNLHGGFDGYHTRMWQAEVKENAVKFTLNSPDMDQGFPGNAVISVTYALKEDNTLSLTYDAESDKETVFNLTNHSYFNLDGAESDSILEQLVWIDADEFTEADAESIPTGRILPVEGTPMDFRSYRVIGREIDADYEPLQFGAGYDHNWVLKNNGKMAVVAKMKSEKSGIEMEVSTDLPGMQLYVGNFLNGELGKDGKKYARRSAACFETQYFPDAVNQENFASPIFQAGEKYHTTTEYRFKG
ncbi:MAG: galactose mutarotase [Lachnospiraceae bacterium]|nr:galactose mutarotase [Lachnospiraceae bacterium]